MRPQELFDILNDSGLDLDQAVSLTDTMVSSGQKTASTGLLATLLAGLGMSSTVGRNAVQTTGEMVRTAYPFLLTGAAALPAAGYAVGDIAARSMDSDKEDLNEIQEQELIAELETNAERLRRVRELQGQDA